MLADSDITALILTLKLAAISTLILMILGLPLAWWLARTQWRGRFLIEALVALPLVLPPTVLGFYLLIAFSPNAWLGSWYHRLTGSQLAFSFSGLVVGSVLYSLPFVVQPLQTAFSAIKSDLLDAAATLRASPMDRFFSLVLPMARPGLIAAVVLGFAHTLGEFGVVLMIGGNLPGETQVASVAIYEHVDTLQLANAHALAGALLCLSFVLLAGVYATHKKYAVLRW